MIIPPGIHPITRVTSLQFPTESDEQQLRAQGTLIALPAPMRPIRWQVADRGYYCLPSGNLT